ncbi:MAG TPA: penicillin acylase family protein [Candidatus Cybelea sp.]
MGFFERPDPRLAQSADPTPIGAVGRALQRHGLAFTLCLLAMLAAYSVNLGIGLYDAATTHGTRVADGLRAPVTILRDRRDIPHIRATSDHDLYFAEGYVQGSDRLFQLDLTRRYAYGRLAEVLGVKALAYDKMQRAVDIDAIAQRQLRSMTPRDRDALAAFSAGVNAAAASEPLPVEFRILLYRPAPWTPKDSLAVSIIASLELSDSWQEIFARDAVWRHRGPSCYEAAFPLSDVRYDVTVNGARAAHAASMPARVCDEANVAARTQHHAIGSNAWAAGAARSIDARALIANDPHLDLTIPGIWYLVDLQSPQVHAAGATIPGMPGVVLGHNENLAWASTNGEMTTTSVFEAGHLDRPSWVTERFGVRFSHDVHVPYYRTSREFSVPNENDPSAIALVRWPIYAEAQSTIATVFALDRARSIKDALRALAEYRGTPQNFIFADRSGRVAWHVAGLVPDDPAWGRYVHTARDLHQTYAAIQFARLPHRAPSRIAILLSANNKAYRAGYPYRLSAQFEPPYRAYRIAQLLRVRRRYDVGYFARMQLDTLSPIDLEIARDVVRLERARPEAPSDAGALTLLAHWNGRYAPNSEAAALEHTLRAQLFDDDSGFGRHLYELRGGSDARFGLGQDIGGALRFAFDARRDWREAGGLRIEHPLSPMNFAFLNGAWLPGEGDEYTIHLQEPGFAQGFRAVWDVGNWDRGGIAIPSGESGEPGSRHYTDLSHAWVKGELQPLPFSDAAVARQTEAVLLLQPIQPLQPH